ncbi:hypothetical protein E5288_WYG011572 [Bos mutus]|uniref:Uncharacterized protein n=1 Tax=Bos mutus TaxID=72004 RepID=A0A6B0RL07_9CETA|nr:hypothetical protein [Bos mutus]
MGDGAAARISVAEMKSYYLFCEWCSWLLSMAEDDPSFGQKPTPRRLSPVVRAAGPPRGRLVGKGVSRWDASLGSAAVFGVVPRGVGAPGHTQRLAVDMAASGWTRAASVRHCRVCRQTT